MWIYYGVLAGVILGFYDFWTKKAMSGNCLFQVVFYSSFFGALLWLPVFFPQVQALSPQLKIGPARIAEQWPILVKSLMMTLSWVFAYFSVRELPMSFSGSVRASGPIWTLAGEEHSLRRVPVSVTVHSSASLCALLLLVITDRQKRRYQHAT